MSNDNVVTTTPNSTKPCWKSVEWLQRRLESPPPPPDPRTSGGLGVGVGGSGGPPGVLVLDVRPHELYEASHVETAINVAVPGLMLRRFRKGNIPVRTCISSHADKERFVRQCGRGDAVLLYDESSGPGALDWSGGAASSAPGGSAGGGTAATGTTGTGTSSGGSVLGLLLHKLWEDGCQAYYLEGGFLKFQAEYPEHCEALHCGSFPGSSPPLSVMGLGNLRISSDCSDGESSEDREPCSSTSATESEESPLPGCLGNQPAFPVQIIPYLYLGCAKDSANLDVLSRHNIKYILNVTPNLPNMFEHDGHFRYKQIPISDHWSQNLSQFFPEAISFIDEARSKQCGILVHCLAGISRSVTVTVAYLMQRLDLSLNDAYDFVKRKKSNISPNFNFMGQLLDFERTLHSPCDNRNSTATTSSTNEKLFFTTPTNHNVFQLDTLEST